MTNEPNLSLDEFIDYVIAKNYESKTASNVAKTIAISALTNLVTIPFGFTSGRIYSQKSPKEIKKDINEKLYGFLKPGFFMATEIEKLTYQKKLNILMSIFDSFPNETKLKVISMALSNQAEYKKMAETIIAEVEAA